MRRFASLGAVVLTLVACGGASGLTKAQYDAKLSHLCLVAADQSRELHIDNTVAAWRHDGPSLIRIERNFQRKLAALKAPAAIKDAAAAYAVADDKTVQDAIDAVAAARSGDAPKLRGAIKTRNKDGLAGSRYAKKIGATGCYIP